ncbi:MAG: helix-turn-helix transcriptional regulator [Clostridia bacterium]|nr:helix-turn-helix transcriptional regulator [Clostridia bacterium]
MEKNNELTQEEQIRLKVCNKIRASELPISTIAQKAHLSVLSIMRILNAKTMPSLQTAIKLSKALEITLDELLGTTRANYTSLKPTK